jgi:hypothetical protein
LRLLVDDIDRYHGPCGDYVSEAEIGAQEMSRDISEIDEEAASERVERR